MADETTHATASSDINHEMTPLDKAQEAADKLFHYRDHYFEQFGIEDAAQKTEHVKKQMEETLEEVETLRGGITNKAHYYMLRGKILNVLPNFDPTAEEALSKAVKLDPKLVEAWNQLGESYWKQGKIADAKNCFTGALNHSKNKVSLRNLSMVLRQLSGSPEERAKVIEDSVGKAREAVELDIQDGTSWLVLGNAYLSMFFAGGQNPKFLKQSMSAYVQAERDLVAANSPDLHYNRSIAYKYQEEYQIALEGFNRARQLDPSWLDPSAKEKELVDYLCNVKHLVETKGKMKSKRLKSLVQMLKDTDLGPYAGGSYTSPRGKTIKLEKTLLSRLKPEFNSEKVVLGKVVCTVTLDDPVPFTFCIVDGEDTCFPVTVYNMAQGYGVKIGDSVAIPEPFVQDVQVKHKDTNISFRSIRVDTPVVMVVNGRKLGMDRQAPSVLSVSAVCD